MSGTNVAREKSGTGWGGEEAVSQASKSFHRWCDEGREVPSSDDPTSVEERKGNESDKTFTQDHH